MTAPYTVDDILSRINLQEGELHILRALVLCMVEEAGPHARAVAYEAVGAAAESWPIPLPVSEEIDPHLALVTRQRADFYRETLVADPAARAALAKLRQTTAPIDLKAERTTSLRVVPDEGISDPS